MFAPGWQFTRYLDLFRSDDNIVLKILDLKTDTTSVSIMNVNQTIFSNLIQAQNQDNKHVSSDFPGKRAGDQILYLCPIIVFLEFCKVH